MALSNYLNKTDFYSYTGLTSSDINESYLDFLISRFNKAINQRLAKVFTLSPSQVFKYYKTVADAMIPIGNWQRGGVVQSIAITNGGSGYTTAPTITLVGGSGSGATAEAIISGGIVTEIVITSIGKDYTSAPTVVFSSGAAAATASISPDLVVKLARDGGTTIETLTEGEDFRYLYFDENDPTETYPIVAIMPYYRRFSKFNYFQVEGTYGYAASVPTDLMLDVKLYDILTKAVQTQTAEIDSGGQGLISTSSIDKVSVSFDFRNRVTAEQAIQKVNSLLDSIAESYEFDHRYLTSIIG